MKLVGYAYIAKTSRQLTVVREEFKHLPHVFPVYAGNPQQTLYTVYYGYTETFCSPDSSEWEKRECKLYMGLNKARAEEVLAAHNAGKSPLSNDFALIRKEEIEL